MKVKTARCALHQCRRPPDQCSRSMSGGGSDHTSRGVMTKSSFDALCRSAIAIRPVGKDEGRDDSRLRPLGWSYAGVLSRWSDRPTDRSDDSNRTSHALLAGVARFSSSGFDSRRHCELLDENGAVEGIRTPDPQIRSLVLYPAELRPRIRRCPPGGSIEKRRSVAPLIECLRRLGRLGNRFLRQNREAGSAGVPHWQQVHLNRHSRGDDRRQI